MKLTEKAKEKFEEEIPELTKKWIEKVKPLIENQGHSGMSFELVCAMVGAFSDRGKEFVKYVR